MARIVPGAGRQQKLSAAFVNRDRGRGEHAAKADVQWGFPTCCARKESRGEGSVKHPPEVVARSRRQVVKIKPEADLYG
jgi:hypothetical protein